MKCDLCGTKESRVTMNGIGYCEDCFNKLMAERYGFNEDFQYPEDLTVEDGEGKSKCFKVYHLNHGNIITWIAENDGTEIKAYSFLDERLSDGYHRLIDQVKRYLNSNTLEKDPPFAKPSLAQKGDIEIVFDEHEGSLFRIDGKNYTADELAEMLQAYEGFHLQYQIRDGGEAFLGKDECLMPIVLSHDELVQEVRKLIAYLSDGRGFISYKQVSAFQTGFWQIEEKLEFYLFRNHEVAIETAEDILEMMEKVQSDDDTFPSSEVEWLYGFCRR